MPQLSDDEILKVLIDIKSYLRITAAASSRLAAEKVIDSQEKAAVYSKLDGKTSSYQISDALGIPQRTVVNWAGEFVMSGLASPPNEFYPSHRTLFSLNELSITPADLKKRKTKEQISLHLSSPTADKIGVTEAKGGNPNGK